MVSKDNFFIALQIENTSSNHSTANNQDGFNHRNFNCEEFNCEIDASQKHIYTGALINGNAAKVGENNTVCETFIDNPSMVRLVSFQRISRGIPSNQLENIAQEYTDGSTHQPRHHINYQVINKRVKKFEDKTKDRKFHVTQQMHHQFITEGARVPDNHCEDYTKEHACGSTDQNRHQKHHQYECEICHLKFHVEGELWEHNIAAHYNQTSFECGLCGKNFKQENEMQEHSCIRNEENKQERLHVVHELPSGVPIMSAIVPGSALDAGKQSIFIKCQFCGSTFDQVFNLQHHMRVHELEKTFKCDVCGRTFESRSTLSVHSFVHSGREKYYCDTCYKVFRVKGTFIRHKARCNQHEDDSETGFDDAMLEQACATLGIVKKKGKLDGSDNAGPKLEHRQCDTTEGTDVSSESLVINEENQVIQSQSFQGNAADNVNQNGCKSDSPKALKSSICQTGNKVNNGQEGLQKSVGNAEMPFQCKLCGLKFEEQKSFLEHSSNHFRDPKQNSLKSAETSPNQVMLIRCNLCGEIFDEHAKLDQHMPSHGVQLSYPCIECGKMFSSNGLLQHHSRVHSDARNYSCDLCQRTFKYKGSLKKHQKHCIKDPSEQENFDRWFSEKLQATGKFNIGQIEIAKENSENEKSCPTA